MTYYQRALEPTFLSALEMFPVVAVTGPHQSGKSTIIAHLLANQYEVVRLDQPDIRSRFYHDPVAFMARYADRVVFDEAQLVPELFEYIKLAVDQDRQRYGKLVVSGSHRFNLLKNISESLAGRVVNLCLLPLEYAELPETERDSAVWQGSYPELVLQNYRNRGLWYGAYLETYLEKDIRTLHKIGDLRDFQRLIHLLAASVSQQLNLSVLARALGVAVSTVSRWVSVLEASYILFLVPPYFNNYGKRLVKAPKIYFYDTGLVSYLVGIESYEHYTHGPMSGALFENYVMSEIVKRERHQQSNAEVYYYRTHGGEEIDIIIDRKQFRELIEVKHNATFHPRMLRHVESYLEENDQGFLVYCGKSDAYKPNIDVLNIHDFLLKPRS